MSKLKKVLSLMLAAAMMLGMMLVPTSAAQFKDADQITYAEEVAITAGLGLFAGADGKFMPKDTVTRAQMATIIVKMLHGADANADAFKGANGGFTDTAKFEGGWAEGYINWCASLGIVKGYGDGTFKPGNKVTAAEAVTMILNALKIDAGEGTWPVTVMAKAEEVKFFEDLKQKPTSDKAMSREELAVVSLAGLEYSPEGKTGYLYNGVVYDSFMDALLIAGDASKVEPAANDTLATKVYELKTAEGFIVANQDTGFEYTELSGGRVFDIETGLDQIGHYVTVYYKEAYESEEKPGVTYAVSDECTVVKVTEAIDTAKEYKAAFGKTYSKNTGITMIDGEYNVSDVTGSIAGYDGGSAAPEGTYVIHKGNIVSYMEPAARYASYITSINTYEGEEGMLINKATEDGSYIPNTEGDDRIVGERGILEGDFVLYTKVQGVYFLQMVDPVAGAVTRVATNEDGETVITFNGKQYVAFDGSVAGVAGKLNTDVSDMIFGETYELYITEDNEFIGFASTGSVKLDDIVYVVGTGAVKSKDNYGKQVFDYVARCVDMEGNELRVVLGIAKDGQVLGTSELPAPGFYTMEDSKDKDAKKEDIKVLTKVSDTYDGKSVFVVTTSGSETQSFYSSGYRHLKTSDGMQTYGKGGSKYMVVEGDMTSQALNVTILDTLVDFKGTNTKSYELLVSRSASGTNNLIEVMVITDLTVTEVASGTGAPVYVTADQLAKSGRTAEGYAYEVYDAATGALTQILVDENNPIADDAVGFYSMTTDDDGLAILTKLDLNATISDAYVRQNQGILGLYSGRDLQTHNTNTSMPYNSSASVKTIDVRSEEQILADKVARITSTAQLIELIEGEEGVAVVADLYVNKPSGADPKVGAIYVTSITRNTPGFKSIVYAFANPGTEGTNVPMALVRNGKGTAAYETINVTYENTIDANTEGFYMYAVDPDGKVTLDYLSVGETANGLPGTLGMHNLVTDIDVAAGTITTEDYHSCSANCVSDNEAVRGELVITDKTVIYDAEGEMISFEELAELAQAGQLIVNYYCATSVFAGKAPTDNTPEVIFVEDEVEAGVQPHRHECGEDHQGGSWVSLNSALSTFTAGASNYQMPTGKYYLEEDLVLDKYLYLTGNVDLCLNGHTLTNKDGDSYIFSFTSAWTLNICDCSEGATGVIGSKDGQWVSKVGTVNSAIIVRANATLNLYNGNISGVKANQVIYIPAGGTFNMYGGKITGNTSTSRGVIETVGTGTVNMFGGEITDNVMPSGVEKAVTGTGTFNETGGTVEDPTPPAPPAPTTPNDHTHDAQWKSLNEMISGLTPANGYYNLGAAQGNAKYYLTDDLYLGGNAIQLNTGVGDITICLNGHTLSSTGKMVIRYNNSCAANLTICDCSAGQNRKVQLASRAANSQTTTASVLARSSGTLNLYGGTLVGGVTCVTTTVNIYGGKIQALADGEVLYIHGAAASKVTIEGGEFEGFNGAAPKVTHKGTGSVTLYGGSAVTAAGSYTLTKSGDKYTMQ